MTNKIKSVIYPAREKRSKNVVLEDWTTFSNVSRCYHKPVITMVCGLGIICLICPVLPNKSLKSCFPHCFKHLSSLTSIQVCMGAMGGAEVFLWHLTTMVQVGVPVLAQIRCESSLFDVFSSPKIPTTDFTILLFSSPVKNQRAYRVLYVVNIKCSRSKCEQS